MTRPNVKRNESDKTETRWTKKKARIRRRREIEEEDREERMEAVREKKQKRSSNRFFVSAARSLETEQLATTQSPPSPSSPYSPFLILRIQLVPRYIEQSGLHLNKPCKY